MKKRDENVILFVIFVLIVAGLCTAKIAHAELVYDDWTCAFARCTKVK